MAILTLTRIFLLTHGQPTLLRELTTPSLAPFASSCLNCVNLKAAKGDGKVTDVHSPLLSTVLQSFIKLIPNHPASLRPYVNQMRTALAPLLAPTPSSLLNEDSLHIRTLPPQEMTGVARRLHALLPHCAAKNGSSDEWSKYVNLTLADIQRTADIVFRGVVEAQMQTRPGNDFNTTNTSSDEVEDTTVDELQFPPWRGIYAGCERLTGLLQLLQAYIATKTVATVTVPIGEICAALERLLSIYAPPHSRSRGNEMQTNPAVSREERDAMYSMLPQIHIAAIDCMSLLIVRASQTAMSIVLEFLGQLSWLFQHTRTTTQSRARIYSVARQIVELVGLSFTAESLSQLSPILRKACRDLLPSSDSKLESSLPNGSKASKPSQTTVSLEIDSSKSQSNAKNWLLRELEVAASRLITISMALLPADKIRNSLRQEMERVAVLMQDEQALLASALNPARGSKSTPHASMLPLLQRLHPTSMSTEALVRPRMPLVGKGIVVNDDLLESEEEIASLPEEGGPVDEPIQSTHSLDAVPLAILPEEHTPTSLSNKPQAEHSSENNSQQTQGNTASVESPKRPRAAEPAETSADAISTIIEPTSKRPRLDTDPTTAIRQAPNSNELAPDAELPNPIIGTRDSPPPVAEDPRAAEKAAGSGDEDSEGSFEIPPIVFDSEMSEDEDEGEEEDEDDDMTNV